MKPWYRKKKTWAAIIGALAAVLTLFLAPEDVDQVKVIAAAIIQAGLAAGYIFAEAGIDKAGAISNHEVTRHLLASAVDKGIALREDPAVKKALGKAAGFIKRDPGPDDDSLDIDSG